MSTNPNKKFKILTKNFQFPLNSIYLNSHQQGLYKVRVLKKSLIKVMHITALCFFFMTQSRKTTKNGLLYSHLTGSTGEITKTRK